MATALPDEIVQAIQRILQLPSQPDDPLDEFSHHFDPAVSLNKLFPDGAHGRFSFH